MTAWLRSVGPDVILTLHVQPGARHTAIAGLQGDALKIRLAAPPVDGKANAALLAFIATKVGAGRADLQLISGQTHRAKRVRIGGMSAAAVLAALAPPPGQP